MPVLQALVTHLDTLIRGTVPDLQYGVKWKNAYYALHGRGWIIETVAYEVSVNLVFFAGAKFDAEPPRARARATSISARSRKPKHRRIATGSSRRQSIQAGGEPDSSCSPKAVIPVGLMAGAEGECASGSAPLPPTCPFDPEPELER